MKKRLSWDNPKDRETIISALRSNEVIVGTSDTVIGLMAQANEKTLKKLNAIKRRFDKPYLLFVKSIDQLKLLIESKSLESAQKLINAFWPGPLTIIFKARESVPSYLVSANNTIAFRMPDHEGIQEILKEIPILFSTSANVSGQMIPKSIETIDPTILDQCNYLVEGAEVSTQSKPSTIVDCSEDECEVRREGAIAPSSIQKILC